MKNLCILKLSLFSLFLAVGCETLRIEDIDPKELTQKLQPAHAQQEESFDPYEGMVIYGQRFRNYVHPRTLELFTEEGTTGLAVRVTEDGYCLTAAHVCSKSIPFLKFLTLKDTVKETKRGRLKIQKKIETKVPVEIIRRFADIDFALIKIPLDQVAEWQDHSKVFKLSDEAPLAESRVFSFGNPILGNLPTSGQILRVIQKTHEKGPQPFDYTFIESSMPIRTGDSGGPALNFKGDLVGVNSCIVGMVWKDATGEVEGEFEYSRSIRIDPKIIFSWIEEHRKKNKS